MYPDQFGSYVAWPWDMFYFSRADPAEEAGPSTTVD